MKKLILLLIIAVLATVLVSCGEPATDAPDATTAEQTTSAETTVAETTAEETADEETTAAFTEVSPAEGETVSLVNARIGDWYSAYTSEDAIGSVSTLKASAKNNLPVAVTLKWSYPGNSFSVIYGTKPDLSDGITLEPDGNECTLLDLFVSTDYYWQITADDGTKSPIYSFVTADNPRLLDVAKLQNARDMGGHMTSFGIRIKQGIVYRTGRLDELPEASISVLNERYGIKTELDLRYDTEVVDRTESWLGAQANYYHYASGQYIQYYLNSYPGALENEIKLFLDPENYPILFHCSVGKDRTGCLAALLQAVCGVDEVTICRDYELSYFKNAQNQDLYGFSCEEYMYEFFLPFLAQMKRTFDTDDLTLAAERMIQSLGFTPADINALRRNLLGSAYTDKEIETWTEPAFSPLPESAEPVSAWSGEQIANDFIGYSFRWNIKNVTVSSDKTYVTVSAEGADAYVMPYVGTLSVQAAPVIAIRYRTSSFENGTFFEVFTDSENVNETVGHNVQTTLENDGKWHTAVIDLQSGIAAFNGYSAKHLRIDLINRAAENDTVDYSFIGLFTSVEAANNYLATLN